MSRSKNRFLRKLYNSRVSKHRALPKRKTLRFESLESKQMLSGTPFQIDLSPTAVTAETSYGTAFAADAFNGDGLTGDQHNNDLYDGWFTTTGSAAGKWLKVDLGGTYDLDHLKVWNGNQTGFTHRGIKQADIYVSMTDPGNNVGGSKAPFDSTGWTLAVENQLFTRSPGSSANPTIDPTDPSISLGGVEAAFLAIRVDSNFGGNPLALAEMQIFAVDSGATTTYDVGITGGTFADGAANPFAEGDVVTIQATIGANQQFDSWTPVSGVTFVDDLTVPGKATFVMPNQAVDVTANVSTITTTYNVGITGGTFADGAANPFAEGDVVTIQATIGANQQFDSWTPVSGVTFVDDLTVPGKATFVMPNQAVDVTANVSTITTTYNVGITGGTFADGAANPFAEGDVVTIQATIGANQQFDSWTPVSGVTFVDDLTVPGKATFVMPNQAVDVTANVSTIATTYNVGITGGTFADGAANPFAEGDVVTIQATIGANQQFDSWTPVSGVTFVDDLTVPGKATFVMPNQAVDVTANVSNVGGNGTPFQLDYADLAVEASTHHGSAEVAGAFNGDGLLGGDLHNNNFNDSWATTAANAAGKWWITVDLGGTYDLDHLKVWNGNAFALTSRGIKQGDIFIAGDDLVDQNTGGLNVAFDPTGWEELIPDQSFTKAVYGAGVSPSDPFIDLQGVEAAHLAIRVDSIWGGNRLTLSEIQIFASDTTPATTYDVTIGGGDFADGAANPFEEGDVVTIQATIGANQQFDSWTPVSGVTFVDDLTVPGKATFVMPNQAVDVTANVSTITTTYNVGITGGTFADGAANPFAEGDVVTIQATIGANQQFDSWTPVSGVTFVDDLTVPGKATFVMPNQAVDVTANVSTITTTYNVGITGGTFADGAANPFAEGDVVTIQATIGANQQFDSWTPVSGVTFVDDLTVPGKATFVMPNQAVDVTANVSTITTTYNVGITGGTFADGAANPFAEGDVVTIQATIGANQQFDSWTPVSGVTFVDDLTVPGKATFVMPNQAVDVTANVSTITTTYNVGITGGTFADGAANPFAEGDVVTIQATIGANQQFDSWTPVSGVTFVDDLTVPGKATFVMPNQAVDVTANVSTIATTYNVGITGGTFADGAANPFAEGDVVTIQATIGANQQFVSWTTANGVTFVDDLTVPGKATFVMPNQAVDVTANVSNVNGSSEVIPYSELTLVASSTNSFAFNDPVHGGADIDGAFNGDGLDSVTNEHDNDWFDAWISSSNGAAPSAAGEWITIDLNGTYDLTSLEIWNGNQTNVLYRSIQQGDIFVAQSGLVDSNVSRGTGSSSNPFDTSGGWMELISDYQFAQSTGGIITSTNTIDLTDPQGLGRNLGVSYLAIRVDSSFSGQEIAIAEIRISRSTGTVANSTLTVNGGTGSGLFEVGIDTPIAANTAPSDQIFSAWTGDTVGVADVNAANTTFTMQAGDSDITANYVPIQSFDLVVNGGTGSGYILAGSSVTISAPETTSTGVFSGWTGSDASNFANGNANLATTTFTMPSSNTTLTATYSTVGVGSSTEVIPFSELTLTASSTGAGSVANAFNSVGMINDFHDSNWPNSWISANGNDQAAGEWVMVDLNGVYDLTALEIWNGNQPGLTYRGIQQGDIFVATSDPGNSVPSGENVAGSGWTLLIENQQFAISPTTNLEGYFDSTDTISLIDPLGQDRNEGVSYLAIHVDSTFAPASSPIKSVAISELRISRAAVTRTLNVLSGTGSDLYAEGDAAQIDAATPPSGEVFYAWTGDVSNVADIYAASTTFTMPANAANLTATYGVPGPFNLTVENGTGGGNNTTGTPVIIQAATAPAGQKFYAWVGADASLLADTASSSTSLVMPPNDVDVTAEYITVNTGAANLALNKTIEAQGSSQNEDPTHPFAHAIDGNKDTYWSPVNSADSSIVVDLGQIYSHIDRVNLQYTLVGAPDYYIEYKSALTEPNWTVATQVTRTAGFTALNVDSRFDPISARYIRYRVGSTGTSVNLSDIQVFQERSLHELVQRDGTPHFIQKMENNQPVTVGYLGGSITAQTGGWREQSQKMFKEMYSATSSSVLELTQKQQTKGGHPSSDATTFETGTGLTRIENIVTFDPDSNPAPAYDVLKIDVPDLVFLEFAVNDETHQGYEATVEHAEIMVRRIWEVKPEADIVFVYTLKQHFDVDSDINDEAQNIHMQPTGPLTSSGAPLGDSGLGDDVATLNEGYYQTSAAAFEEIADYYGIPTIHMGMEIASRVPSEVRMDGSVDGLTSEDGFDVFSPDGIHPYASTGHVWYTEALTRSFNQIKLVSGNLTRDMMTTDEIRGGSAALAASTSGGDDGFLTGLALESQQLSATDEALLLFEEPEEEESGNILQSDPSTSNDIDNAFQQLGQQSEETELEEEEEEEEDFGALLVSSGLGV